MNIKKNSMFYRSFRFHANNLGNDFEIPYDFCKMIKTYVTGLAFFCFLVFFASIIGLTLISPFIYFVLKLWTGLPLALLDNSPIGGMQIAGVFLDVILILALCKEWICNYISERRMQKRNKAWDDWKEANPNGTSSDFFNELKLKKNNRKLGFFGEMYSAFKNKYCPTITVVD